MEVGPNTLDGREILELVAEASPVGVLCTDAQGQALFANGRWARIAGLARDEALGDRWAGALHPEDLPVMLECWTQAAEAVEAVSYSCRFVRPDGGVAWVEGCCTPYRLGDGGGTVLLATATDVTERELALHVREGRQQVLHLLAKGAPLEEVLTTLARHTEEVLPGVRCTVLLLDREGRRLLHGAAPSMPESYVDAIEGLEIGPAVGSCGTAAFTGERVVVEDIQEHPYWEGYRSLARGAGIQACWSEPISSSEGEVLGTFALYYGGARGPSGFELDFMETTADLAAIAIQHKRAEEEVHRLERQVRRIIDLVPHMIFAKDWDGTLLLANQAVADVYGITLDELIGKRHAELHTNEEELRRMLADDREVMESGRPKLIPDETFVDARGQERILQTMKIPYVEPGADRRAVLGVAVDITELKAVERSLRESEERFRQIADHLRDACWLTDWVEQRVLYVNSAYEEIWGRPCPSLYEDPRSWMEAVHPEDRERVGRAFREDAATGSYDEEYRVVRPDGSLRWIHDRAFPIRDADGRVYRVAGISEDITERKRSEQALRRAHEDLENRVQARTRSLQQTYQDLEQEVQERERAEVALKESEGRFRELAENIADVFWLASARFDRVFYVSPAYEKIWGRPREGLYRDPRDWVAAIHPEDQERVDREFSETVLSGKYDTEYRIIRPDGEKRWIHDRGYTVRDEAGEVVRITGLAQDVTLRKQAELQLAAHQEQLRSLASELVLTEERERRRLAVDLHDGLNQVMTLTQMKLSGLRKNVGLEHHEALEEIEGLVDSANQAARSLTFQLSPPVLHDLGLEAGVQWLVEDLQQSYGLAIELDEEGVPIEMDERLRILLFRAIRELLINVAKHAKARRVVVRIRRDGPNARITVQDDGVAFDPAAVGDRGFGLFSIRERLNHLSGDMHVRSAPGKGTTVELVAPLKSA